MMNTDNECYIKYSIKDAIGQQVYEGDRVVFCYRGLDGKKAKLLTGTVMRVTKCGVWAKPDNPSYGHKFSKRQYDADARKFVTTKYYEHNGWKWSSNYLVVELGS